MLPYRWRTQLFGGIRIARDIDTEDETITRFSTSQTALLFACLALETGKDWSRDALAERIWPDEPSVVSRHRLRQSLLSLRRQLEPPPLPFGSVLVADRTHLRLNPDAITTDVAAFEQALLTASEAADDLRARLLALRQAVTLAANGELLPGYEDAVIRDERDRLRLAYIVALRGLVEAAEQIDDLPLALDTASRLTALEPLDEEAGVTLVRLLAKARRIEAAGRAWRKLRRALQAAGIRVSDAAAREVRAAIAASRREQNAPASIPVPSEAREAPPVSLSLPPVITSPVPILHLPLPLTRLFGRQEEIAQLLSLLAEPETRFLTLTGSGGAGKTRLAVEVARRDERTAFFVPLADVVDTDLVADKIADSLLLPREGDRASLDRIVRALTDRGEPLLLILDNVEQLLHPDEALVDMLRTLLTRVPGLVFLATSRVPLGIESEQVIPVSPLPVPSALDTAEPERDSAALGELIACPSVALFADRMRASRPDFQVTARNAAVVAALCRRLDGLPLALEIAATWARTLTPAQMLEKTENRFVFLVRRQRGGASDRHLSLQAAMEWGFALLPPDVQRFFPRLSVFRGGFTAEAAAAICGESEETTLALIAALQEHSFVFGTEVGDDGDGAMRYSLLDTVRDYGREMLLPEEQAVLTARHAAYYLDLAENAEPYLRGHGQKGWMDRLEQEHDNLRGAQDALVAAALAPEASPQARELPLRFGAALFCFWYSRGYLREGEARLHRFLEAAKRGPGSAGSIASMALANALAATGCLARSRGDYAGAQGLLEQALVLWQEVGSEGGIGEVLCDLGFVACRDLRFAEARKLLAWSLELFERIGDRQGRANALNILALTAWAEGKREEAMRNLRESLALFTAEGNERLVAFVRYDLGRVALAEGDYAAARAHFMTCLETAEKISEPEARAFALEGLACLETSEGRHEAAAYLWGRAARQRAVVQAPVPPYDEVVYAPYIATARAALGDAAFTEARERGESAYLPGGDRSE